MLKTYLYTVIKYFKICVKNYVISEKCYEYHCKSGKLELYTCLYYFSIIWFCATVNKHSVYLGESKVGGLSENKFPLS